MKNTTTSWVIAFFLMLPIMVVSQHNHENTEHFFSTRSLTVFEQDLGLQIADYIFQNELDHIDQQYQTFHETIESRLHN